MKLSYVLAVAAATLALAGCELSPAYRQQEFSDQCKSLGAVGPALIRCVDKHEAEWQAQAAAALARWQAEQERERQENQRLSELCIRSGGEYFNTALKTCVHPTPVVQQRSFTCTTYGNSTTCY